VLDRAELMIRRNAEGDRVAALLLVRQAIDALKEIAEPDAPALLRARRLLEGVGVPK
jgi:hypothetical protein